MQFHLVHWLTDWLIKPLTQWLTDWLTNQATNPAVHSPTVANSSSTSQKIPHVQTGMQIFPTLNQINKNHIPHPTSTVHLTLMPKFPNLEVSNFK